MSRSGWPAHCARSDDIEEGCAAINSLHGLLISLGVARFGLRDDFFDLFLLGLFDLFALELQMLLILDVDLDEVLALELAGQDGLGERVFLNAMFDRST